MGHQGEQGVPGITGKPGPPVSIVCFCGAFVHCTEWKDCRFWMRVQKRKWHPAFEQTKVTVQAS